MPPLHPSRPDAMLQLSTGLLGFGSGRRDVRDAGFAAVEAEPEGFCLYPNPNRLTLTLTLTLTLEP